MTTWSAQAEAFKSTILAQIKDEWRIPSALFPLPKDVSDLIPRSGVFSTRQLEILSHDALGVRDAIAARRDSCVEVAEAYCKAAAVVHQATNCLMGFFPQEAIERARWLDAEMERTGKVIGPLHGVPVSVKGEFASDKVLCQALMGFSKISWR